MTDIKEELTKMLMEYYDKGVADTKKAAEKAIVEAVDFAIQQEREACALICENMERNGAWITKVEAAAAIRARGEK